MPRKKAEDLSNSKEVEKQIETKQLSNEVDNSKRGEKKNNPFDVNIENKAEKLYNKILRVLYATYGIKDSHANKHLYQHVMFEVAYLSNKAIEEVMQTWPKFDIFTISEKIKKIVEEELRSEPTIMYQVIMNDRIIADRILAKAIAGSIVS
jgi:galactitol-specific phosphotransferase system IIB component